MNRNTLRAFFHRALIATLPLGATLTAGCPTAPVTDIGDAAVTTDGAGRAPDDLPYLFDLGRCGMSSTSFVPLDGDAGIVTDGGMVNELACTSVCGTPPAGMRLWSCKEVGADGGTPQIECDFAVDCTGRRPEDLAAAPAADEGTCGVGAWLARAAYLEAASVDAFERLADELAAHGAPTQLVQRARAAARDEIRHAEVTSRLARRHGAAVAAVAATPRNVRALEEIAVENAAEGCVRETFGVLQARLQAQTARDPQVRLAMAAIAEDEALHAELAWDVAAWAERNLGASEIERVRAVREEAVEELASRVEHAAPESLRAELGLPSAEQARVWIAEARRTIWS